MPHSATTSLIRFKTAFAALLLTRPLDQITVQDIVRKADVNRSTFYRHFLDINDFLDWLADTMLSEITQQFPQPQAAVLDFTQFYQYATDNRILLQAFLGSRRWTDFVTALQETVAKRYTSLLNQQTSDMPPAVQAAFLIGGHIALFNWWMQQDQPPRPAQMAIYHKALSRPR
ncbi:TetR family transcriptional regulator [Lacticaseibacillus saniviri]|uniref:HTH tetR-type domain-containing protein n=1 Tax=Lacticaseibacillus saniviri JCM 17471 = DSM 24301 TaxID=1293598 RepID=A0A0R2MVQ6_9LACO|nr:TetR family transcriptional regulator [Lacticaseibacillus saniviri]KRO17704.1 hypothetical protein IV56_GL002190 [Lacticaseibacillus saniviri JCM 17471 = DSM 24301]MCG4281517.1 TetR/AcrR family transcriptional regulator [Lacticaseibacillus saniviri]